MNGCNFSKLVFFIIRIHSTKDWTATARNGVTKKNTKVKISKTEQIEHQDIDAY